MMKKFLRFVSRPNLNIIDFVNIAIAFPLIMRVFNYDLLGLFAGILALVIGMVISVHLENKYGR